ncbi:hypothetical protein RHGRI_025681 [Rhododendron griersonianum]|uniref:glucan endo-1,3-beta-D-glucosidase n=1 Tax=Rhododendron griersonianum TaxID=479676 RepID=A0AAV6IPV7_9ERIC|nr:hypothetical protein RHGRI_025681 [Rhododendron griersonianum]
MLKQLCSLLLFVGLLGCYGGVDGLGVNWGTIATHKLPPKVVVQMLKDNGIKKVKLFDADQSILNSLAGSGIEVMIAIQNDLLGSMGDYDVAKKWVEHNVTQYTNAGVNITYVAVGNEPFLKDYKDRFTNVTFPALQNVQNALNDAGIGNSTKATVPLNADIYESPSYNPVPSAGRFRPDITDVVSPIVKFLDKNNAPFTVNIYPFLSLYYGKGQFPIDFAFFDGVSAPLIDNNGVEYTNVFEANLDTLISALKAEGCGNLSIIVGEIGWPTDGEQNANALLAQKFYNGFARRLAKNVGTPLRPGYIEVYFFGLLDENAKSTLPGDFEPHWGIFRYDGQPKFPLDLSGQGQNKSLVAAKNVTYQAKQWCALNPNAPNANLTKLEENVKYACSMADCTPLGYGKSCSGLDGNASASFAFNAYFQNQNQNPLACDFEGLAKVTTQNISQANCNFTIQIAPSSSPSSPPAPAPLADAPGGATGHSPPSDNGPKGAKGSSSPRTASMGSSPSAVAVLILLALVLL